MCTYLENAVIILLGGNSDKEAFELALRRDSELQKRQLETMFQIRKSIRHERGESRVFPERVSDIAV